METNEILSCSQNKENETGDLLSSGDRLEMDEL